MLRFFLFILSSFLIVSINARAMMPSNPVTDPNFDILPNQKKLSDITVRGTPLSLSRGSGNSFSTKSMAAYRKLKTDSQNDPDHKVQWVFMNLDNHQVIAKSLSSNRKIFGASSSKIFVGGTLLDKQAGILSDSQWQKIADMLVISSNSAWTELQSQIGEGNSDTGRERIHQFTQRMGYVRTRGFQGYWGNLHGNELTASETADYLYDIYKSEFPGSEILWKLMHTCRTGANRGLKYIPTSIYVGGKTGTYDGTTVDPESGKDLNPDGTAYKVSVRNHMMVFYINGTQYALTILADTGSDESAALLAGGLIREYTGITIQVGRSSTPLIMKIPADFHNKYIEITASNPEPAYYQTTQ
jgi:hypothetical protein